MQEQLATAPKYIDWEQAMQKYSRVYQKIANASIEKKNDIYRYELMMPFKKKWDCYSVPMKASTPNGYDVIMASSMLGLIAPSKEDKSQQKNIERPRFIFAI